jgi:exodeoxyribonuclease VII small subunit
MAETGAGSGPVETFESCLEQLEQVVRELEGGELPLERSLELFERGVGLTAACRKQLEEAETRVDLLVRKDGKTVAEPYRTEKPGK